MAQCRLRPGQRLLLIIATVVASAALAQTPEDAALAGACYGCHGQTDNDSSLPSLVGQSYETLAASLREYQAGTRDGTLMSRIARGYSLDELDRLARHFSVAAAAK